MFTCCNLLQNNNNKLKRGMQIHYSNMKSMSKDDKINNYQDMINFKSLYDKYMIGSYDTIQKEMNNMGIDIYNDSNPTGTFFEQTCDTMTEITDHVGKIMEWYDPKFKIHANKIDQNCVITIIRKDNVYCFVGNIKINEIDNKFSLKYTMSIINLLKSNL